MKSTSLLVSTIVVFVILFLLGFLYYALLMDGYYASHNLTPAAARAPEEVSMGLLVLGQLFQAYVISLLYRRWSHGHHDLKTGFALGSVVGLFAGFGMGLVIYATSYYFDLEATVVEGIWCLIYYGIAGAGAALVFKRMNKTITT